MNVTLKQFQKNPGVPPGIAAHCLGISRQRVGQLLRSGKLESLVLEGERFVSIASILARLQGEPVEPALVRLTSSQVDN